jgi:hypothetical protein
VRDFIILTGMRSRTAKGDDIRTDLLLQRGPDIHIQLIFYVAEISCGHRWRIRIWLKR